MKQVIQRLRDGRIEVLDVPTPELRPEGVLVDVRASLLSAGTERKKVETARQTLLGKARARPDQVRQVVDKARRDGIQDTMRAVRFRLEQPSALGYSTAGVVLAAGERVRDLAVGDRVACAGADYAVHAEIDYVPANLAVRVPDGVDFGAAAFATVGSIALHGVRQTGVRLGEHVAIVGLGLVGQLAAQILRAGGCRVLGVDLSSELVALALELGAADAAFERRMLDEPTLPNSAADCDAVLITAATRSSDPIRLAGRLCRDRGRVVVVGDVGIDVPRDLFYEKELELRLSRSYGPGRYDSEYEERGLDYPVGYVRWTERRNMEAFLELVSAGKVQVEPLVSARLPVQRAAEAYELLVTSERSPLGILLDYAPTQKPTTRQPARVTSSTASPTSVGVIGAGSFANRVLLPGLRDAGFELRSIASASGLSAKGTGERFRIPHVATVEDVLSDPDVGLVAIATRHGSHAELAARALHAGKHVFVEKPPALDEDALANLRSARDESGRVLAVGFNRRHAPLALRLREHIGATRPFEILIRVNAGLLEPDHWLNDLEDGGGRLLGEGCHFVDLACWLTGSMPQQVACTLHAVADMPLGAAQSFAVTLDFGEGSLATILYGAHGSPRLGKEYVEAHAGGRSGVLDDFRALELSTGRRVRRHRSLQRDKGHEAQFRELRRWLDQPEEESKPDPLATMETTLTALRAAEIHSASPPGAVV